MTKFRLLLAATCAALLGAATSGVVILDAARAASSAEATPSPNTTPRTPVPGEELTRKRGLCIRTGTGELRSLWLVAATGKCPSPYWGPVRLSDLE
jgi:hypothetical protein